VSFAIRTFIQTAALVVTLEAALFLAKGGLGLSAEDIALLSATRIGFNPELIDSLAQQQADTWIGVVLLLFAFLLQMWNALWPLRIGDFGVHKGGALCALGFSIVLGVGAFYLSKQMASNAAERARTILKARGVAGNASPSTTSIGIDSLLPWALIKEEIGYG
jgi:hypothetical protein